MLRILSAIALAMPAVAAAQTFEMDPDSDAKFVRCVDMFGTAQCEVIFPTRDSDIIYRCVALSGAGEPLAVAQAFAGMAVIYPELDAAGVDRVACDQIDL